MAFFILHSISSHATFYQPDRNHKQYVCKLSNIIEDYHSIYSSFPPNKIVLRTIFLKSTPKILCGHFGRTDHIYSK